MGQYVKRLHQNLSSNGNGSTFLIRSKDDRYIGDLFVIASGAFGSGSLVLQYKSNNSVWRDIPSTLMTESTDINFKVVPNVEYRFSLSGATGAGIFYEVAVRGYFDLYLDF